MAAFQFLKATRGLLFHYLLIRSFIRRLPPLFKGGGEVLRLWRLPLYSHPRGAVYLYSFHVYVVPQVDIHPRHLRWSPTYSYSALVSAVVHHQSLYYLGPDRPYHHPSPARFECLHSRHAASATSARDRLHPCPGQVEHVYASFLHYP